jgi:hypothetical protein
MKKNKSLAVSKDNQKEPNIDSSLVIEAQAQVQAQAQVKGKRGRKSKKDLMAALNLVPTTTDTATDTIEINHVSDQDENKENVTFCITDVYPDTEANVIIIANPNLENIGDTDFENTNENAFTQQAIKKRGRKPKGGKIIQQVIPTDNQTNDKPNVILHLKCSMKDLNNTISSSIDSYTFNNKSNLAFDLVGDENINSVNVFHSEKNNIITNSSYKNYSSNYNYHDNEDDDEDEDNEYTGSNKDSNNKEIWRKLKVLEHSLHNNNVNNKKSACFWDSCDFDNPPVYIPKHYINGTYHVYGCFCSPECGVAHLMNENIDSSTKFERYHLFNHIYSKIYDYKKNIKPAPNPHYMLEKFYGNLSIQEYRSLLRNERLFIIVDKPLTRILPELHDDNDEFILNNKIIPSNNNHQLKSRMNNKKKTNKSSILNEKFGISVSAE